MMSARFLLITEVSPIAGRGGEAATRWLASELPPQVEARALYRSLDGASLLELLALGRIEDLGAVAAELRDAARELAPLLATDWRRQVLEHVEEVRPSDGALPRGRHLQLRHVEVRPPVYADYRAWRERTIFQVVRRSDEIESFSAYHSLLSTEPGVMFLSGFSVPPDSYQRIFSTEEYAAIVREAGDTYITGGTAGLYTRLYTRIV